MPVLIYFAGLRAPRALRGGELAARFFASIYAGVPCGLARLLDRPSGPVWPVSHFSGLAALVAGQLSQREVARGSESSDSPNRPLKLPERGR